MIPTLIAIHVLCFIINVIYAQPAEDYPLERTNDYYASVLFIAAFPVLSQIFLIALIRDKINNR